MFWNIFLRWNKFLNFKLYNSKQIYELHNWKCFRLMDDLNFFHTHKNYWKEVLNAKKICLSFITKFTFVHNRVEYEKNG